MASVQELLLAAQGRYQRPKSQIGELSDIINGGLDTYADTKSQYLGISRKMVENQMLEQARAQVEASKAATAEREDAILGMGVNKLANGTATPATKAERLRQAIQRGDIDVTVGSDGKSSITTRVPTTGGFEPRVYQDSNGQNRIGKWSAAQGLFASPNDPLAERKVDTSGGVSNELRYRMDKDKADAAQKTADELASVAIPGFKSSGQVKIKPEEAQKLRDSVGKMKSFEEGIDKMIQYVKTYGASNMVGDGSGEMESLASQLILDLKDVKGLGQISGADIAIVEGQVGAPQKFNLKRRETVIKQLESAKEGGRRAVEKALAARGMAPEAQTVPSFSTLEEAEAANLPTGTKIMIGGRSATVQ